MNKWIIEIDSENEQFKILTSEKIIKSQDGDEQQWVACVYEHKDAIEIVRCHNKLIGE